MRQLPLDAHSPSPFAAMSLANSFVPIKQEMATDEDNMALSPVSDSDVAMMMAPPTLDKQDFLFQLTFSDEDSSDSHGSVKTEDGITTSASTDVPMTGRRTMTPEERRARRNMKERLRIQGIKIRIEQLRQEAETLAKKYDAMKKDLDQRMVVRATHDYSVSAQSGLHLDDRHADKEREFLQVLQELKKLELERHAQEELLRKREAETAALKDILASGSIFALKEIPFPYTLRATNNTGTPTGMEIVPSTDPLDTVPLIRMDAISVFEAMIAEDPLTPDEARGFVEDTCREMMEELSRRDWIEGFEGFGWRGSRRLDVDGAILHYRLSQTFKSVSASELVQKTWTMLTNLDGYRRIQPQTQQLRVIQRVNDDSWVIGIAVGKERVRLGHVLVARAIIHGGYLVTFQTLPLIRKGRSGSEAARQKFVEAETGGMHVTIHSWYNFQERPNATGGVDCEVIFGGSGRYGDRQYLQQLQTEIVAGMTRWQAAVGFSSFLLSSTTLTNTDEGSNR